MLINSSIVALLASIINLASAEVTVYTAQETSTAAAAAYSAASVDQTVLQAPAAPANQAASVPVQLYDGGMIGLGLPVSGGFLGFSIELSVANTLMGENAGYLKPEFLNYCAILEARGGSITIRVGGNTQDGAVLNVNGNPSGKTIQKYAGTDASATKTPVVHFTLDLFYAMAQIHNLVDVNWFFGIPFLATDADGNAGLVVQNAMSILGSKLLGLQMANEPDLYAEDLKKGSEYNQTSFLADTATMIQRLPITQPIILGPSICCRWDLNSVLGDYMTQFASSINYIDIIHYPNDNCAQGDSAVQPQSVFANYLNHNQVQGVISPYFPIAQTVLAAGKKFMMLETNTASCGGFAGVSNTFASALWGVDFGLQMAWGNFSYALFHFGGQNVFYNPFTPPPTNMSTTHQWTTGPIFYANIVVAEALGKSGNAQVIDLYIDNNNANRAGYAVYEKGVASRVVLINYVSSPGVGDYTAVIAVGGQQTGLPIKTPASVRVKYLLADSVTQQYNITWAGQTMGTAQFTSDGRLSGTANIQTIACDTTAGTCSIPVPAPSVALVFLTDAAYEESGGLSGEQSGVTLTYPTTTTTGKAKATINLAALATTNGRSGSNPLGATSKGAAVPSSAWRSGVEVSWLVAVAGLALAWVTA